MLRLQFSVFAVHRWILLTVAAALLSGGARSQQRKVDSLLTLPEALDTSSSHGLQLLQLPAANIIDSTAGSKQSGSVSLEGISYGNEPNGLYANQLYTRLTVTHSLTVLKQPLAITGSGVLLGNRFHKELSSIDVQLDKAQSMQRYKWALVKEALSAKDRYKESLLPGGRFAIDSVAALDSLQAVVRARDFGANSQHFAFLQDSLRRVEDTLSSGYARVDSCKRHYVNIKARYDRLLAFKQRYTQVIEKYKPELDRYDSLIQAIESAANVNALARAVKTHQGALGMKLPQFNGFDFLDNLDVGSVAVDEHPCFVRSFAATGASLEYSRGIALVSLAGGVEKSLPARMLELRRPGYFQGLPERKLVHAAVGVDGGRDYKTMVHAVVGAWSEKAQPLYAGTNVVVGVTDERTPLEFLKVRATAATSRRWANATVQQPADTLTAETKRFAGNIEIHAAIEKLRSELELNASTVGPGFFTIGNPYLMRGVRELGAKHTVRLVRGVKVSNEVQRRTYDRTLYSAFGDALLNRHKLDAKTGKRLSSSLAYEREILATRDPEVGASLRQAYMISETWAAPVGRRSTSVLTAMYAGSKTVGGGLPASYEFHTVSVNHTVVGEKINVGGGYIANGIRSSRIDSQIFTATASYVFSRSLLVSHQSTYVLSAVTAGLYLPSLDVKWTPSPRLDFSATATQKLAGNRQPNFPTNTPYVAIAVTYKH